MRDLLHKSFEKNINEVLTSRINEWKHFKEATGETSTITSDQHRLPFLHGQHKAAYQEKANQGHARNAMDDRALHKTYDKNKRPGERDNTDDLTEKVDNTIADANSLNVKYLNERKFYADSVEIKGHDEEAKFKTTAAKLKARSQKNRNEATEELEDVVFQSSTILDIKPKADLSDNPSSQRNTFSLQSVFREKPKQISALGTPGESSQNRENPFSLKGNTAFPVTKLNLTDSLNSSETSEDEDSQQNIGYTSINRSKSVSTKRLYALETDTFELSDDEMKRKRKHRATKLQLSDLTAQPKKSILKKPTSPPSENSTSLNAIPLSQLVSSTKDGESNPSLAEKFYQPSGKTRSIMFSGTPTLFGGNEPMDKTVQRSLSYNERRHQKSRSSVSERPPTPAVFNRKKRKADWNMSTTKF